MNKKALVIGALAILTPASVIAVPYTTTGGYGNPVLDSAGASYVNTDGIKATYAYTATDITPVATATDVVVIGGSATKTIRISSVCVGGTATAASIYDTYNYMRTTADTGGTATNPTPVKYDSQDGTAAATVSLYTANPTTGTGSVIKAAKVALVNATTPGSQLANTCWVFGNGEERPILRGVAQQFAIGHNGAAVPAGASIYYSIEWTEEP